MKTFSQFLEDTGTGNYDAYEKERTRRKTNKPSPTRRRLAWMLQKDLPPPEYRSSAI
jgi:hypothetical protein